MAKIAFLSRNNEGHLFQVLTLASHLQSRGHNVTLMAQPGKAADICREFAVDFRPIPRDELPIQSTSRVLKTVGNMLGRRADMLLLAAFIDLADAMLVNGYDALRDVGPDLAVVDQNTLAGSSVCEALGIPFVSLATSVLWHAEPSVVPHSAGWKASHTSLARTRNSVGNSAFEVYMKPVLRHINKFRRSKGLGELKRVEDTFSGRLQLAQLSPRLDLPRSNLPSNFRYIGSLGAGRSTSHISFPWHRLDGRPLVFASLGTVQSRLNQEAYQKILEACNAIEAQLVLSLGRKYGEGDDSEITNRECRNDQIVVPFAPQTELLDRASLLITHAGVNTVLEATLRRVPIIALPRNADQPAMATRIVHAGIGTRLPLRRFTPKQLRDSIERVLNEQTEYKEQLRVVSEDLERAGGVKQAADYIVQALPV